MNELDKHKLTMVQRHFIIEFLEWLDGQKLEVAAWRPDGRVMFPIIEDRSRLLDRFLGVDAAQLERERRALLAKA